MNDADTTDAMVVVQFEAACLFFLLLVLAGCAWAGVPDRSVKRIDGLFSGSGCILCGLGRPSGCFQGVIEGHGLNENNDSARHSAVESIARIPDDGIIFRELTRGLPWFVFGAVLAIAGTILCCRGRGLLGLILLLCCIPCVFFAGNAVICGVWLC